MISDNLEKLRPYEKGDEFYILLQAYDRELFAYRDYEGDRIVVYSKRQKEKVFEFEIDREFGETWPEIERKAMKKLPDMDVWRRFGNTRRAGLSYDDWLFEEDKKRREKAQKEADDAHMDRMREDKTFISHVRENARAGRFTTQQAKKYEIPTVLVDGFKDSPKEGKEKS